MHLAHVGWPLRFWWPRAWIPPPMRPLVLWPRAPVPVGRAERGGRHRPQQAVMRPLGGGRGGVGPRAKTGAEHHAMRRRGGDAGACSQGGYGDAVRGSTRRPVARFGPRRDAADPRGAPASGVAAGATGELGAREPGRAGGRGAISRGDRIAMSQGRSGLGRGRRLRPVWPGCRSRRRRGGRLTVRGRRADRLQAGLRRSGRLRSGNRCGGGQGDIRAGCGWAEANGMRRRGWRRLPRPVRDQHWGRALCAQGDGRCGESGAVCGRRADRLQAGLARRDVAHAAAGARPSSSTCRCRLTGRRRRCRTCPRWPPGRRRPSGPMCTGRRR
jgi:hypothetical protein